MTGQTIPISPELRASARETLEAIRIAGVVQSEMEAVEDPLQRMIDGLLLWVLMSDAKKFPKNCKGGTRRGVDDEWQAIG